MSWKKRFVTVVLLLASLMLASGVEVALADSGQTPPIGVPPRRVVSFRGAVESRPEGTNIGPWVISGRTVQVVESTRIDETEGPAEVGARVMVVARRVPATDPGEVELEAIVICVLPPPPEQPITIRGLVTELESTYLVVNGLTILYDASTEITGDLEVGAYVKIRALRTAEGLKALTIEVLPINDRIVEFEGIIEQIGHPVWVIGGRRVTVTRRTRIIGHPEEGLSARVRAQVKSNGDLLALVIEVQNEEPEEIEWNGIIEWLPPGVAARPPHYYGRWVVGGRSVQVTPRTEVHGTPRIGLAAHVVALRQPGKPLMAKTISILDAEPVETLPQAVTPEAQP